MEKQNEFGDFLRSRRDRIGPEQAGLIGGGRRRVPGLRREEVALLAGVSADYYAKMERGELGVVSAEVLDGVSRALCLNETETDHLHQLAVALVPQPLRARERRVGPGVQPGLQRFLDAITGAPVWVRDQRMNFVAANDLGAALYAPILEDPESRRNTARFTFLNPSAKVFYLDWERSADAVVATLRGYAGRNPRDRQLTDLIGELATRSDTFRVRWASHDVRDYRTGTKRIHHPEVGDLELPYQAMELSANPGWQMFAYTAEPNTPTAERLALLGSLAVSTPSAGTAPQTHDRAVP
ncbi:MULTISPECIES: helix-turn-helix transcriptional regulator [unclassified Microbacterium]|uniref:helix-turn-helix transcriptional regulator n=1 Tax=unclassified Microbacterium TaxID=2609290 RepID=UPI00365288E8